jgi:hypothetical protein
MGIFAAVYTFFYCIKLFLEFAERGVKTDSYPKKTKEYLKKHAGTLSVVAVVVTCLLWTYGIGHISKARAESDLKQLPDKHFFNFITALKYKTDLNVRDLVVLNTSLQDCWSRYYVLFITGSEARIYDQFYTYKNSPTIPTYRRILFVTNARSAESDYIQGHQVYMDEYYRALSFAPSEINNATIAKLEKENVVQRIAYKCQIPAPR